MKGSSGAVLSWVMAWNLRRFVHRVSGEGRTPVRGDLHEKEAGAFSRLPRSLRTVYSSGGTLCPGNRVVFRVNFVLVFWRCTSYTIAIPTIETDRVKSVGSPQPGAFAVAASGRVLIFCRGP